ncbi:hypothetical protein BJY52DRAFT_1191383 [Lactarius psammicola]|nr:hypothetical protein BJY52DRAFT_1191383 [Lactarius psammicola]
MPVNPSIAVGVEYNLSCFANEFATCHIFVVAEDLKSVFGVAVLPEPRVPADILEKPEADRENPDRTITVMISVMVDPRPRRPGAGGIRPSLFVTPTARLVPRGRHDRDCPHIRARAHAEEDQAPGVILERTVVGGEDEVEAGAGAEHRWKRDEWRASGALERPVSFDGVRTPSSDSLDRVVAAMFVCVACVTQAILANIRLCIGIEEVIGGRLRASPYVGLKRMDEVLNELRAAAGVDAGGP